MALLSACGGSSSGVSSAKVAELGVQYANIVAPLQQAEGHYESSGGQPASVASVQSALRSVGSALLKVTWPGRTENDIRGLVSTFNAIDSELELQLKNPAAASSQAFNEYLSAEQTDSTNVRRDLGLAVTGTTP
jgi:hypothetical protein